MSRSGGLPAPAGIVETEITAEAERYRLQRERADLTSIEPDLAGGWRVEMTWLPGRGETGCRVVWSAEGSRVAAERSGLRFACLRGAARCRVFDPGGAVVASWDREGNCWLRHDRDVRA